MLEYPNFMNFLAHFFGTPCIEIVRQFAMFKIFSTKHKFSFSAIFVQYIINEYINLLKSSIFCSACYLREHLRNVYISVSVVKQKRINVFMEQNCEDFQSNFVLERHFTDRLEL